MKGEFVEELDETVQQVKPNRKAMKEFMTYEMTLMESRMEGFQRGQAEGRIKGRAEGRTEGTEIVALKMIHKGKSFEEIHEMTELPIERIKELADKEKILS